MSTASGAAQGRFRGPLRPPRTVRLLRKLNAMFEKRRRMWRSPRDGPAQLLERLVEASGGGERRAKQGLDDRIFAAARGPFQRRDRLGAAVLHQQRMAEDLRRADVAAIGLQHTRRRCARPRRDAASATPKPARSSAWSLAFGRPGLEGSGGRFDIGPDDKPKTRIAPAVRPPGASSRAQGGGGATRLPLLNNVGASEALMLGGSVRHSFPGGFG